MGSAPILDLPWAGQAFNPPTPIDIATVETAITNQLKAALGNQIAVEHFGASRERYRLTHRVGAALVVFAGADYGHSDRHGGAQHREPGQVRSRIIDTGAVVQERILQFTVTLLVRDLGWGVGGESSGASPGGYALLEAVRASLTGFQPNTGTSKMYPLYERFVEYDRQGGVFTYEIAFATVTMAVEASLNEDYPLFIKGVVQEEGGITVISVPATTYTFSAQNEIQLSFGNVSNLSVRDQASDTLYQEGTDYTVDYVNGIISLLVTGSIANRATVDVAYSYAEVVIVVASGGSVPLAPSN